MVCMLQVPEYTLGFNFAIASVLSIGACVYRAITDKDVWLRDDNADWVSFWFDVICLLLYVLIFLVMTSWSTIRINKMRYDIIAHEQCYYLSKHTFNLLCIELWTTCSCIKSCLHSDAARGHSSKIKSICDRKFYNCCACACIFSDHDDTRSHYIGSNLNDKCYASTMKILSVLLILTSGVFVVQRVYCLYLFCGAFVLVLDVNSDRNVFLQIRNKVNRKYLSNDI